MLYCSFFPSFSFKLGASAPRLRFGSRVRLPGQRVLLIIHSRAVGLAVCCRVEVFALCIPGLLFLGRYGVLLGVGSWRTPVTCHDTLPPGLPPAILKLLPLTSWATYRPGMGAPTGVS